MKPTSYYLQTFIGFSLGVLLVTLILDEFYPTLKSLFVSDANTSQYFQEAVAKTNWTSALFKPLFVGAFVTYINYVSDKKKANNK